MQRHLLIITTLVFCLLAGHSATAGDRCSVRDVAGNWAFATGIGRQALGGDFPPGKDITAIGTMDIERNGTISGRFDIAVQDAFSFPGITYTGVIVVNPDCTGTVTFQTSVGSARTDSIVIVSRREILAMSLDPLNLWTYQIRRIARGLGRGDHDDD